MSAFLHQPFWCEENIWHLAQHPDTAGDERFVLVITGATAEVACWQQRAAPEGAPLLWDYHVVLAVLTDRWRIWDLDTRAGCPLSAEDWLTATFPLPDLVPARFRPRFALIPAEDYVRGFGSDRAHMRGANGEWLQPPPAWPAISGDSLTLGHAIRLARQGVERAALAARLAGGRR